MRTRTHLTTPPGIEPSLSAGSGPDGESWSPALAVPQEPRVPGPRRRLWVTLAVVLAMAVVALVAFRITTAGQSFDPALDPAFAPDGAGGGLPGDG